MTKLRDVTISTLTALLMLPQTMALADNKVQPILSFNNMPPYQYGSDFTAGQPSGVVRHAPPGHPSDWGLYGVASAYSAEYYAPAAVTYIYKLSPPPPGVSHAPWTKTILWTAPPSIGEPTAISSFGGLAFDKSGAAYGTVTDEYFGGSVFKLIPPSGGATAWTYMTIYKTDYRLRSITRVVIDPAGSVYGTNYYSGNIFQLKPSSTDANKYTYSAIHSFSGEAGLPYTSLAVDGHGNIYGGISNPAKAIFKLSPPAGSGTDWSYQVLYTYTNTNQPWAAIALDAQGNIYAGDASDSTSGAHYVFRLSPPASGHGAWTKTFLAALPLPDRIDTAEAGATGIQATGSAILVTTAHKIVQLTPPTAGAGSWTATTLKTFIGNVSPERDFPFAFDASQNIYGTTVCGLCQTTTGSVFKLYR